MTSLRGADPVLAATGLRAEARLAVGPGVIAVSGGGDPAGLARLLQGELRRGVRALISFGIAGGLAPDLPPGTVVIARSVIDGTSRTMADPAWLQSLARRLPQALIGDLAGTDRIVVGRQGKNELHDRSGAVAVDMESHIAARLARQHRLPFAALRVVADPAGRSLPHAATVGLRPDGTTNASAVLRALCRRPHELPALLRTAMDARAAFASLRQCRAQLGATELGFMAAQTEEAMLASEPPDTPQASAGQPHF